VPVSDALEGEVVIGREVPFRQRNQITASMIAPQVTWKPWNPVSMKKVEP